MVFSSTIFLFAFLPLTLAGYYFVDRRFKNYFLLAASLLFYAWGEPKFVFVMIASILVNHVFALLIDRDLTRSRELAAYTTGGPYEKHAKKVLALMVVFNLSLFFVYKYMDFTITNVNAVTSLFGASPIPLRNIALPIGISFFTFQAMSYVFDVYYGRGRVQKNPLNTMLYVALFPQLIAGPIVRYETVAEEINSRKETMEDFVKGIKRFIIGLGKKTILANSLAIVADKAFGYADFSQLTVLMAWFGIVAYMLQIYFDFGGYSDMAIGLGLMFGFHFEENFIYPYISRTIGEFWRRWHISMGSWFRDYLFMPVSRSEWLRKLSTAAGKKWGTKARRNTMAVTATAITWLATGLWHGANWTFIIWGCWHGMMLILDTMFSSALKGWTKKLHIDKNARWFHGFQIVRTLFLVMLGYVMFRSGSARDGFRYIGCLFGFMGNGASSGLTVFLIKDFLVLVIIAVLACTPVLKTLREKLLKGRETPILDSLLCLGVLVLSIAYIVNTPYDPFIYFNF